MPVSPRSLVELILLGPIGDRRQLQDSPVLGDVWMAYAQRPAERLDLLITPDWNHPTGRVAAMISRQLAALGLPDERKARDIAYLNGLVAARVHFRDLLRVIVPMTTWWQDRKVQEVLGHYSAVSGLHAIMEAILRWVRAVDTRAEAQDTVREFARFSALDRYVALAGVILWASEEPVDSGGLQGLVGLRSPGPVVDRLRSLFRDIVEHPIPSEAGSQIYQVSLNRRALAALDKSVAAVKGDAARHVFKVKCDRIGWAVLDSGIDGSHPAFAEGPMGGTTPAGTSVRPRSRVVAAYDFSDIRKIVSLDNLDESRLEEHVAELLQSRKRGVTRASTRARLRSLAEDADNDRPIHWELVEDLIRIDPTLPPKSGHGTHVAGIIGARQVEENGTVSGADGMCPDITLYDFRVLSHTVEDTEFAIIAALQFVRYLNNRQGVRKIHGANLSLSIPHDVRNFACGRTPICDECRRLVDDGVVVVAAAGNLGYQSFETKDGVYDGYAAFSITDPGNAEDVITVGATHRFWPHTYGVSFFSSRGPTGDGRIKPDLVAPGERIQSCLPGGEWGSMDGTSMAAPHVSGAAAMLMARYSELMGQPREIKRLLCESATDLSRERTFQGRGMLDVLRAFQRI